MMDPINMQRLARLRQQEILEGAERDRQAGHTRLTLPKLDRLIQAISMIGQKMTGVETTPQTPALDTRELRVVAATDSGEFPRPVR